MKNLQRFGPLFVIIAALLWSADGLLRRSLYVLPPAVIVFYEHIIGFVILLIFIKQWFPQLKKLNRGEWIAILLVSFFSGLLGTLFYTAALGQVNYIQYSVVVLLQQLQPIWAIAAAAIVLKEKVTNKFLVWAALALIAAYFISFKDLTVNFSTGQGTMLAATFAILAGMCWGSTTALSKKVLNKVTFITATSLRFFFAPLFALIFIIFQNQTPMLFALSSSQLQTLLLITFSTGLVALAIYYYGLSKIPARVTTLCELVWPASAVLIDYFFFHNSLSVTQILGIILLGIAIYNVTKTQKTS